MSFASKRVFVTYATYIALMGTDVSAQNSRPTAAPPVQLVKPLLDFGVSTGRLLIVAAGNATDAEAPPSSYVQLAQAVQRRIEEGRAAAGVVAANAALIEASLTYAAVADPEPLTKLAAGVAAYGANVGGDYLVRATIEESEDRARQILARGLKESGYKPEDLKGLSSEEIRQKVNEFRIGGQSMKEILNDPKSLELLQEHMIDLVNDNSLESLRRTEILAQDVSEIRGDMQKSVERIDEVKAAVLERASRLEASFGTLAAAVKDNSKHLDDLWSAMGDNTRAINALAEVSFSGWTTQQKLHAVRADLFPALSTEQRTAMLASLEAQAVQERVLGEVNKTARDLSSIASIANSLGLPQEITNAASAGATLATGAAQLLSGDYLGGFAAITSLAGLGRPDAGAERHRQMMEFMAKQFQRVNQKLDEVLDLQRKTLSAIAALQEQQQQFRVEVLTQLNRIEAISLDNNKMLQALLNQEWRDCDAMAGHVAIRGEFRVRDRAHLLELLSDDQYATYVSGCYSALARFLDGKVQPLSWSGEIVAAEAVQSHAGTAGTLTQNELRAMEEINRRAYVASAAFMRLALAEEFKKRPALVMARLGQPMPTGVTQRKFSKLLADEIRSAPGDGFLCDNTTTLSLSLRELLCYQKGASPVPPAPERIPAILSSPMLGPGVERLVNEGHLLSTFADLSYRAADGSLKLVTANEVESIAENGLSANVLAASREHRGRSVLIKLLGLIEVYLLQQSVAYGDYTAEVAERALYDPATKSLSANPPAGSPAAAALAAMKVNPVLARNVVLLALRHAIADRLGSFETAEASRYLLSRFHWSRTFFEQGPPCSPTELSMKEWNDLLPGWRLTYRASPVEKAADRKDCPDATLLVLDGEIHPSLGSGVSLELADFYVLLPTAMKLATGQLEQPVSLLNAMAMRSRTQLEITTRNLSDVVNDASGGKTDVAAPLGRSLLNVASSFYQ